MFGTSQVGVIQNESFRCVVSTVLERVRQSYSTLVSSPLTASGARTRTNKWFAKATLPGYVAGAAGRYSQGIAGASRRSRMQWHRSRRCVGLVLAAAKGSNPIINPLNQARLLVADNRHRLHCHLHHLTTPPGIAARSAQSAHDRPLRFGHDRGLLMILPVLSRRQAPS